MSWQEFFEDMRKFAELKKYINSRKNNKSKAELRLIVNVIVLILNNFKPVAAIRLFSFMYGIKEMSEIKTILEYMNIKVNTNEIKECQYDNIPLCEITLRELQAMV